MKIQLPISVKYVSHWGLWEAVREILQNAYDERDGNPGCELKFERRGEALIISTSTGLLSRKSLVLGESEKKNDSPRGKFGEGYKLALVALLRLGKNVIINNGPDFWHPSFANSTSFDCEVLEINIHLNDELSKDKGVEFVISSIDDAEWEMINNRVYVGPEMILRDRPGTVFVGGLFVTRIEKLVYGYAFDSIDIKLDRDRGMVSDFDVTFLTSRLWSEKGGWELFGMIEDKALDVQYCDYHIGNKGSNDVFDRYTDTHGEAIPVSNQAEVERAVKAKVKWVLVPPQLQTILHRIKTWIIPDPDSLSSRLRKFGQEYGMYLPASGLSELKKLIKELD